MSRPHPALPASLLLGALALLSASCSNRLGPHRDLLVGVPAATAPLASDGQLSVTYLGVNGYLLRSGDCAILVDPFFSRVPLREVVLNAPVAPSPEVLAEARRAGAIPERIDAFLVTHSHFDHLLDVPALQAELGGKVVVSRTGAFLCEAVGTPRGDLLPSAPGDVHRFGAASVRVLPARHDLVLGSLPYPGILTEPPAAPPSRAKDWRLGTPLAFLVEMGGRRVYIESGGVVGHPPPVADVDLAIVGAAVGEGRGRYAEAVSALRARHVLPSHQDNFFNPLSSGFHFSALSDFPRIKVIHRESELPGRLVLTDYFHVWTVPGPDGK